METVFHVAFLHFHTTAFLRVSEKSSFSHPNVLSQLAARAHRHFDQSEIIHNVLRNIIEKFTKPFLVPVKWH